MFIYSSYDDGPNIPIPRGLVRKIAIFNDLSEISSTPDDAVPIRYPTEYLEYFVESFKRGYEFHLDIPNEGTVVGLVDFAMFLGDEEFLEQMRREAAKIAYNIHLSEEYPDHVWYEVFLYSPFNAIPQELKEDTYFVNRWLEANGKTVKKEITRRLDMDEFLREILPKLSIVSPVPGGILRRVFLEQLGRKKITLVELTAPDYETTYILSDQEGNKILVEMLGNYFHARIEEGDRVYSYYILPREYRERAKMDIDSDDVNEISIVNL